jgi:hypothetical protein
MWSILNFGKHAGKSLPEVVLHDPDWFFWAIEGNVLEERGFGAEANDLDLKARNIKIPRPTTEHWCINYVFSHRDKFCGFNLVQVRSAAEAYANRLDLSVVYARNRRNKSGNEILLRDFKTYYFGTLMKLTRKQCEEFFDNAAKFYEPRQLEYDAAQVGQSSAEECTCNYMKMELSDEKRPMQANDAMFVWTPDRDVYRGKEYPLRGKIHLTTIPESAYTRQHPRSLGACNSGWEKADLRWQMAQRMVIGLIHEDNIPEDEVRRVVMQVDEFATFPFSTELPDNDENCGYKTLQDELYCGY